MATNGNPRRATVQLSTFRNQMRRVITWVIQNEDWGLMRKFGPRDVREIKTRDFQEYIEDLSRKRPDLSPSTKNTILAAFRNVLKIARDDDVLDRLPDTPRTKQKD